MTSMLRKGRVTRLLAAAALGLLASGIVVAWVQPSAVSRSASTAQSDEFCATAPIEARASPRDLADVLLNAAVPANDSADVVSTVSTGSIVSTTEAMQGDIVRVTVHSPRDGGIAVHGLLDVRRISADDAVTVEFRAIYSGRFPVHFHGTDGSHIQIAAIEVRPSGMPVERRAARDTLPVR